MRFEIYDDKGVGNHKSRIINQESQMDLRIKNCDLRFKMQHESEIINQESQIKNRFKISIKNSIENGRKYRYSMETTIC